jgi:predicted esterase
MAGGAPGMETEDSWTRRSLDFGGRPFDYAVRPAPASAGPLPPAILFLHGRGESGRDGRQTTVGLPRFVDADPEAWPFLVVAPQKPDADRLWPDYAAELDLMLAAVARDWPHDPFRRVLTGLSQGGNGTLVLAKRLAWTFAAVAPVCGWANPMRTGRQLADLPVWLFHGSDDRIVPPSCSQGVSDCIAKNGGRPKLTLYGGVGHDSWDHAYAPDGDGPALSAWLLSHRMALPGA